ncbi:ClpP/crotonase-like domain-containing protein [Phycomyces nitens]|nr:ClpP/crotonase-like domain-containing protein [Phycomyces nitens]
MQRIQILSRAVQKLNACQSARTCTQSIRLMATASKRSSLESPALFNKVLSSRKITLNRPERLNALNHDMIKLILPNLLAWEKSELANVIILKGSGRALCAGGDVRDVVESLKDQEHLSEIISNEYRLLHTIATLETPYVALMDGITMGAGGALCAHGGFRVATENTVFAMPETAIGLFPDVGSSFFLPRLDGKIGTYMAMTGNSVKGEDVLFSGLATHFVPSSRLPALESRLAEIDSANPEIISDVIEEFAAEYDSSLTPSLGGSVRKTIDNCFKYDTVEEIIGALKKDGSEFALKTKADLLARSPTALKVTLEQMRIGSTLGVAQCLKMEYKLLQTMANHHDFTEGVTARLINKTEPKWKPSTLAEVKESTIKTDFFETRTDHNLTLLSQKSFSMHPFRKYGLPSEEEIRRVIVGEASAPLNGVMTQESVVEYFVMSRKGKFGVREKVSEVLDRKTKKSSKDSHKLEWVY